MTGRRPLAVLALAVLLAGPALGCPGGPCAAGGLDYRIVLPEGDAPHPAVMMLHGFGGSGEGVMRMRGLVEGLRARGWAVIAPDGRPREDGPGRRWIFRGPDRDDDALRAVRDDAARHGVDPSRVMLAGFSNGGFMATYLACRDPGAFRWFAPVAGGFWRPHPARCAGPVRLLHVHGWADRTVPLEGRPLGNGARLQGDVLEGLAILRAANGCGRPDPTAAWVDGGVLRRRWDCAEGAALELVVHPGGHAVPSGWATLAVDWAETPRR